MSPATAQAAVPAAATAAMTRSPMMERKESPERDTVRSSPGLDTCALVVPSSWPGASWAGCRGIGCGEPSGAEGNFGTAAAGKDHGLGLEVN
jgi:hypothetical protein